MSNLFNAVIARKSDNKVTTKIESISVDDLPAGDVLVEVAYSSLNYKDGLAVTGRAPICKTYPMVCGIDLAGVVVESTTDRFKPGDQVFATGSGLSETVWGGYTQQQRLPAEKLLLVPKGFSLEQLMAIGTAGFTAMLCVMALEEAGVNPDAGEVLVTGAGGGVGSMAIVLLANLGFKVVAATGRPKIQAWLTDLGATDFVSRAELARQSKPLESQRWVGAVDTVGSDTLATVLSQMYYSGVVTCCGLAGGADLPANVIPFILRNVKLIGCDSVNTPYDRRLQAWERLSKDLNKQQLTNMITVEPMSNISALAESILAGQVRGRVVIDVNQ